MSDSEKDWESQLGQATSELRYIDAVLDRRPAIADLPNRCAKIEKAIHRASQADMAEKRLEAQAAVVTRLQASLRKIVALGNHTGPDDEPCDINDCETCIAEAALVTTQ